MSEPSEEGPVLIAYDGSDCSKAAIEEAGRQLRGQRPAIVLTVWEPLDAVPFWGAPMATVPTEITEEVVAQAEKVAAEGVALANDAGFEARPMVELGAPVWTRIVETAEGQRASVIVLGSHGRSSVGYAFMGSVATAVAHHAKAPVLITRRA
jgi:nucleotide-binding universal stress UspA family protein